METVKFPSGVSIPKMTPEEAERRSYLSKAMLDMMHLSPVGNPAACSGEGTYPVKGEVSDKFSTYPVFLSLPHDLGAPRMAILCILPQRLCGTQV